MTEGDFTRLARLLAAGWELRLREATEADLRGADGLGQRLVARLEHPTRGLAGPTGGPCSMRVIGEGAPEATTLRDLLQDLVAYAQMQGQVPGFPPLPSLNPDGSLDHQPPHYAAL